MTGEAGEHSAIEISAARDAYVAESIGIHHHYPERHSVVPRQLPAPLQQFIGRRLETKRLNSLLGEKDDTRYTLVIAAIAGAAGIGKTSLAVRWAHDIKSHFPDGQLYVNLRGFDPSGSPMTVAEAIRGFLDAFEVSPEHIPVPLENQVTLYRSLVSGKRLLVLLDNARDAEQVRPLLPGSPGSLVLITSRDKLLSLVALEGAYPVTLDVLTEEESFDLLARRLGTDRVSIEPTAATTIISLCARLPLALAVVAARAITQPRLRMSAIAEQLGKAHSRLESLIGGDAATNVRTVLSWSYDALTRDAARLFRLLSLHPGPDISAPAAASLAGVSLREAERLLAELVSVHMVSEQIPNRYAFHDILRAYAAEETSAVDTEGERLEATQRMLDHYLRTAYAAALLLYPHRDPITLGAPRAAVTLEHLADNSSASAWFAAERRVITASIEQAAEAGSETYIWQMAWTLENYLFRHGHWQDHLATQQAAAFAAGHLGDSAAEARVYRSLARANTHLANFEKAEKDFLHALELSAGMHDLMGQAHALHGLAWMHGEHGNNVEALGYAGKALSLYRTLGYERGQADALNAAGWNQTQLGDHEQALLSCEAALSLFQRLGDRYGEAATWDSMGDTHSRLGDLMRAIQCYEHAVDLLRGLGDSYDEADTLVRLGDAYDTCHKDEAARRVWAEALSILDELGHPDADRVRNKLGMSSP